MPSLPPFRPRNLQTLATEIEEQREKIRALEAAVAERKVQSRRLEEQRLTEIVAKKEEKRQKRIIEANERASLNIERRRALSIQQGERRRADRQNQSDLAVQAHLLHQKRRRPQFHQQEEQHRRDRERREDAGMRAYLRPGPSSHPQRARPRSLEEPRLAAYDGPLPSFLDQEHQYMKQASSDFPELITSAIQMSCMKDYQRAISNASKRLPCGLCGGLYQEDDLICVGLQDDNLQYFLQRTETAPDCCAVKDNVVSLCTACNSAITKRAVPLLSAGNYVNCLFCQDYPECLKNLNVIEEAFIARTHVIGIFLKLTTGAKKEISYRGSRGHSVAVRQDPSQLLKILPTKRLQDHTTITVSWDRGSPPSEENLARFCSVNKMKVLNALLWLCATNPIYKSVVIDYSVLDAWPDYHIPQEIRDAFITVESGPGCTGAMVEDEREGYAVSLQGGLFENELDAEIEDAEPGGIVSRSFFSDLHGQDLQSTPATLTSLQAILQDRDLDDSALDEDRICDERGGEKHPTRTGAYLTYRTRQHENYRR
jgi:hypothetical protein